MEIETERERERERERARRREKREREKESERKRERRERDKERERVGEERERERKIETGRREKERRKRGREIYRDNSNINKNQNTPGMSVDAKSLGNPRDVSAGDVCEIGRRVEARGCCSVLMYTTTGELLGMNPSSILRHPFYECSGQYNFTLYWQSIWVSLPALTC